MANLTAQGPITFAGNTSVVDTTKAHPLGTCARDSDGNEYIYVQGIGSCVAGSWVTVGASNICALAVSGASGRVGVAMAAIVASSYGWVQIYGWNTIALASSNGTIASGGGQLAIGGTGLVVAQGTSVGAAAGDYIFGAFAYSAQPVSESTGADVFTVFLNRPFTAVAAAVAGS